MIDYYICVQLHWFFMYDIILAFITAFSLTFLAIPSIISVAKKKHLMDEPDERRVHSTRTPSLGGIGIFAGMLFSIILWTPFSYFGDLQYILCAFIIIFLIGAKDDIDPITPKTKFLGQLFSAAILVFRANVKITSLYGVFGIYDLPEIVSVLLSILIIVTIINAFNLIDGINGLSGGIGVLLSLLLGTWFYKVGSLELAMVSYSLAGSSIAFLYYNITPAKIFMGDTGALLLGLVFSILAIQFVEMHKGAEHLPFMFKSAPAIAVAILIIPLFDTLRVFTLRILDGKSPFYPDKTHIHHLFLDAGFTHTQASISLVLVNFLFIALAVSLQDIGTLPLIIVILGLASMASFILSKFSKKRKANA